MLRCVTSAKQALAHDWFTVPAETLPSENVAAPRRRAATVWAPLDQDRAPAVRDGGAERGKEHYAGIRVRELFTCYPLFFTSFCFWAALTVHSPKASPSK